MTENNCPNCNQTSNLKLILKFLDHNKNLVRFAIEKWQLPLAMAAAGFGIALAVYFLKDILPQ